VFLLFSTWLLLAAAAAVVVLEEEEEQGACLQVQQVQVLQAFPLVQEGQEVLVTKVVVMVQAHLGAVQQQAVAEAAPV
jgi:hypothetical protein